MKTQEQNTYFIAASWRDRVVPNHFRTLAEELTARGHRVVLLLDSWEEPLVDAGDNPAVYTWPSFRPTGWADARFLWRLLRRYRPAAVVANFGAVNLMMVLGWLSGTPCRVAWYHTLSTQIAADTSLPSWKLTLLQWRKRAVYATATHLAANSQASADDAQNAFGVSGEKTCVWPNSLPDPLVPDGPDEPVSRNGIVCVGRLDPSKGQDVLLRALARIGGSISVTLIGNGAMEATCRELATEIKEEIPVEFIESVPHDEVLARMAQADLVVSPSRSEAFGLVNVEALAVGTPVVASRVGGIPEIVRDGVDGLLVPPDDPQALAAALQRLLDDPGLRATMGQNARQRFLSTFERSAVVGQQADWLERIVNDART